MTHIPTQLIRLGAQPRNKAEALEQVAALLSEAGYTDPAYLQGMQAREEQANTYLGKGVAIPHGTPQTRHLIHQTGVAALQVPAGVSWGEGNETVRLIFGIAAASDEHLAVLRSLTRILNDDALVERLSTTTDVSELQRALDKENATPKGHQAAAAQATAALPHSADIVLPNPQGMHARPATQLGKLVKSLSGKVRLSRSDDPDHSADATRLMEVLSLGLGQGTCLRVQADSQRTLQAVLDAIRAGLGDDLSATAAVVATPAHVQPSWEPQAAEMMLEGVPASAGLVAGPVRQYRPTQLEVADTHNVQPAEAAAQLDRALASANAKLSELVLDIQSRLGETGSEKAAIFEAHKALLQDEGILEDTAALIMQGHGAAWSYQQATNQRIETLRRLDDPTLAGRAVDLSDVQRRVLRLLLNVEEDMLMTEGAPYILLAEDLTPSDTARLDLKTLLGFATEGGGATSHTAIMARGLNLPATVAVGAALRDIPDGTPAILDGESGRLYLRPSEADMQSLASEQARLQAQREAAEAERMQPGKTRDGQRVEVVANINRASAAEAALEAGAEGVGLMRTEFLFLENDHAPTEAEQEREYRAMAKALGERPLIIRTLDIGGDKEVSYLGLKHEDNSFLGIRGIRLCFERPDLFLPQLRAIVRVAAQHPNVHVMFPMIATLEDFHRARELLRGVEKELGAPPTKVGAMIEVPSAALIAHELAPEVDFFSIGTNDLTSYTLAMDRLHPTLARQVDALHPAVLRLIAVTAQAAQAHGKWVGVCGGAAGEIAGALVLTGLGVRELSVSTPAIANVKAALRRFSLPELQTLAQKALAQGTATDVRSLVAERLSEEGA